mmetsp:Transcript_28470/g.80326  ORF Transcript_28470/g.80326 Transcript_28470/m.80326 type:complete len:1609 (+) Transcript_28470:150-4976(+)
MRNGRVSPHSLRLGLVTLLVAVAVCSGRTLHQDFGTQDTASVGCGACPEGMFLQQECDVAAGMDRVCHYCEDRCGEGVTKCVADGNGDAACSACNFPGVNGDIYLQVTREDGFGECKFCSPCDEGEFLETRCSETVDNICKTCRQCSDGEIEVEPCSKTADTVCQEDTFEELEAAAAANAYATTTTDVLEVDSTEPAETPGNTTANEGNATMAANTTQYNVNRGNTTQEGLQDREGDETDSLADGMEIPAVNATSVTDRNTTAENAGTEEEGALLDMGMEMPTADLSIMAAKEDDNSPDSNPSWKPMWNVTTLTWNASQPSRNVQNCSACGEGYVKVLPCNGTQDTVCKAVEGVNCGECPFGEFLAKECDKEAGEDRQCKLCSARCGEGVMDCIAVGGGDAHCPYCNFGPNIYAEDRDGDGFGECKFCSPCKDYQYLEKGCTSHQDNICRACSVCDDDEIEVQACGEFQDSICEPAVAAAADASDERTAEMEESVDTEVSPRMNMTSQLNTTSAFNGTVKEKNAWQPWNETEGEDDPEDVDAPSMNATWMLNNTTEYNSGLNSTALPASLELQDPSEPEDASSIFPGKPSQNTGMLSAMSDRATPDAGSPTDDTMTLEQESIRPELTEHRSHLPVPEIEVEMFRNYSTVSISLPTPLNSSDLADAYLAFDIVESHETTVETPICHKELEEYPQLYTVNVTAPAIVAARLCLSDWGSDYIVTSVQVQQDPLAVKNASSDAEEHEGVQLPPMIVTEDLRDLPDTVSYGTVLHWRPHAGEDSESVTIWYRLYHSSRHEEIQAEPPTVDCKSQVDRSYVKMTEEGIVATFPAVIVAFSCHSGESKRSPLLVHHLQINLSHTFITPEMCVQCTIQPGTDGVTISSQVGGVSAGLTTSLDILPIVPPADRSEYLRIVQLTGTESPLTVLFAPEDEDVAAQADSIEEGLEHWADNLMVGEDTGYKSVEAFGQLLIFTGDELWGKLDLPLSTIKIGDDARFFTMFLIDQDIILLEDSPLRPPAGGMRLRVVSRTSSAPDLYIAATTDEGEWKNPMEKGAELEPMTIQGTANLCLQGDRPCRAKHYQLLTDTIAVAPNGATLELLADIPESEDEDSMTSISIPYATDEALTVVLPHKGDETFVIRRDFAGSLFLDSSTYLNIQNVSLHKNCSSEASIQVKSPGVVRSSVCDEAAAEAAPPVYRILRAALEPPAIQQARQFVQEDAESLAEGTMTVSAVVTVSELAYIKMTMDPDVGSSISCNIDTASVMSTLPEMEKSSVQVELPLGVSTLWSVACPQPTLNGLQYDPSIAVSSSTVVALPINVKPLADDEAQLELSFHIQAPAEDSPATRTLIATAVEAVITEGGAIVTSLEEIVSRRALLQDSENMISYAVSVLVLVPAKDAIITSETLQQAAQPDDSLDRLLQASGMAIEEGPQEVPYTCSERQSLDCQMSEWDWVCGATDDSGSCWANRSATVLFIAGACGTPCGATKQSAVVPCGALPASCTGQEEKDDNNEEDEGILEPNEESAASEDPVQLQSVGETSEESGGSSTSMYIGIGAVVVVVLVAVIMGAVLVMRRRRRSSTANRNAETHPLGLEDTWETDEDPAHHGRTHAI